MARLYCQHLLRTSMQRGWLKANTLVWRHGMQTNHVRVCQLRAAHYSIKAKPRRKDTSLASCSLVAASFLLICMSWHDRPHWLESQNQRDEDRISSGKTRYNPYEASLTSQMADDYLRWDEHSMPLQAGSNMLRYDQVRVPSNNQPEDTVTLALGKAMDGELEWLAAGIFDGHA